MCCTMNNQFCYKQFLLCSRVLLEIGPLNSTKVVDFNAGIISVICCLFQKKLFLDRDKPIIIHEVYILSEINDDFSRAHTPHTPHTHKSTHHTPAHTTHTHHTHTPTHAHHTHTPYTQAHTFMMLKYVLRARVLQHVKWCIICITSVA